MLIIKEEEVATNCDGAVLLGTKGKLVSTGFKSYVRGVSSHALSSIHSF